MRYLCIITGFNTLEMNQVLFLKEMKRHAVSLIIWMTVITILISVTMSVYRPFMENQSKVLGMLSLIPKGALQFKGISNVSDLSSPLGFYAINNVIYMMVLGSIFAIVTSSGILLKEEYNKTAEYLLTRPVTRGEVFLTKLAVMSLNVLLINVVTSFAGFLSLEIVKKTGFSIGSFLILSLYTFLLNYFFGAAGLLLSTVVRRPKPITTSCIGLVLIYYFIYTVSKITESVSKLGYLSPFRYVDLNVVNAGYKADPVNIAFFLVLPALMVGASYRIYLRKDIYT
jgi:ABC-2 type transport system permease protein